MNFSPHDKPIKSLELLILEQLNARMDLPPDLKQKYNNLVKGYEGQVIFNTLLQEKLSGSAYIILNDLRLSENGSLFQIDITLIYHNKIFLFEIKNFEGDFIVKNDKWYSLSGTEISNPVLQLKRAESLFRRYLRKNGFSYPIEAYVVFVNPSFTLYQAPSDLPIIFPTQLTRLIQSLNSNTTTLHKSNYQLASQLMNNHISKSRQELENIPSYDFTQLTKGILGPHCFHFLKTLSNRELICEKCNYKEDIDSAILRSTQEFALLFPETKITTSLISKWCKLISNEKRIRRVLMGNLKHIHSRKYSHYTFE